MERNTILSLILGYVTTFLPVWSWDSRSEMLFATFAFTILFLVFRTWTEGAVEAIKKVLTSDHVKTLRVKDNR